MTYIHSKDLLLVCRLKLHGSEVVPNCLVLGSKALCTSANNRQSKRSRSSVCSSNANVRTLQHDKKASAAALFMLQPDENGRTPSCVMVTFDRYTLHMLMNLLYALYRNDAADRAELVAWSAGVGMTSPYRG